MSFLEQADKAAKQVEEGGGGIVFSNFGRLDIQLHSYKKWVELPDGKWTAQEIEEDEYNVTKDSIKFMEIDFVVLLSEMNPELQYDISRKVSILKSRGKRKSDWDEIVRPSIDEVFGADATLTSINGKYVETQDILQMNNKPREDYKTIKFVRTFDSREACKAAYDNYQSQFKKNAVENTQPVNANPDVPTNYTKEQWDSYVVPAIKDELSKGSEPGKVANDYGIPVKFVIQLIGK